MSFNYQARRVRDPGHPLWLRLSSLRACVRSYCTLSGANYAAVSADLGIDFLFEPGREPPADEFLRRTLDQVERERTPRLARLREFERARAIAKKRGNRQLSKTERAAMKELR
jgi:hypothetical protein